MTMLLPEPGVYHNMDDSYFDWPYASKSSLSKMSESAAACKHALDGKWKQTYAMAFGQLVESALQRPEEIKFKYIEADVVTPTANKFIKCQLDNPDKTVVAPLDILKATEMAKALLEHKVAKRFLVEYRTHEQSAFVWDDPATGVRCKCKTDAIGLTPIRKYICDLKKIRGDKFPVWDASRGELANKFQILRYMRDYKYDWQANFYKRGAALAPSTETPDAVGPWSFVFVFIDDKPGRYDGKHRVAVVEYTEAELAYCTESIDAALRTFGVCQASGEWPEQEEQEPFLIGATDEVSDE